MLLAAQRNRRLDPKNPPLPAPESGSVDRPARGHVLSAVPADFPKFLYLSGLSQSINRNADSMRRTDAHSDG